MKPLRMGWLVVAWLGLAASSALAQSAPTTTPAPTTASPVAKPGASPSFDQVIDLVVDRENRFLEAMRKVHPLVETYIQNVKADPDLGSVPVNDQYFFGRFDLGEGPRDTSFLGHSGLWQRSLERLTSIYSLKFLPLGFAQMVLLDTAFDRRSYDFTFVRREFLGDVRCLVIDVHPKEKAGDGRFLGRIWVEDEDYNIVRFNGTYWPAPKFDYYLHFDSWRQNVQPGMWLPAFIYSEETNLKYRLGQKVQFKAQTRLWGYDLQRYNKASEFTQIQVESTQQAVQDVSPAAQDNSPVQSARAWQFQAEENAIERLQKIGLLAPAGEVDKVLQTVANNLMVTNNIELEPEVRCRVLLTTPLESFTIGHTIVISRGLLDVLPDEASLAMVVSHELSHIVLGHRLDTKLAFNDQLFFPDEKTFERLDFTRDPREEEAADKRAVELLGNSPYKDKLATPGLFLRMVQERAPRLEHLIRPHLGNTLKEGDGFRMSALLTGAPALELKNKNQIAALPLGGRVKVDPWSNQVELLKTKAVPLATASEKMPFEITPFFPHLTRLSGPKSVVSQLEMGAGPAQ